ncbi:AAA family ATPase [Vibrio tapetis subsp. quintayensis]|uniref:ExeA family protein n=1 Tax=Vibrio tapetis TaxID=52443 RepID=UPI0025B5BFC9|nr:AAA family ATPase [Vibrio tapetis]MDN3681587.1 AAA family ATPase [Vibrio tapetis subsp. quintayensis]
MYKDFFGFAEAPFSIVPNARYIFLSERHREAINHLQAGLGNGGGFAMLTGEVGTGKTTVSKAILAGLPDDVRAGLLLNPTYSCSDLLESICDEYNLAYPENASLKVLTKAIHQYLLGNHEQGAQTLLVIDEAQHLAVDVLEQLRLLTNLETDTEKLLKVLLIGQPELQANLQTTELRQLAQRITGRYHLLPLSQEEVLQYIEFRCMKAGGKAQPFSVGAMKAIAKSTQGVPRLINLICDKSLQYAYQSGESKINTKLAVLACQDVMAFQAPISPSLAKSAVSNAGNKPRFGSLSTLVRFSFTGLVSAGLAAGTYVATPQVLAWYQGQNSSQVVVASHVEQPKVISVETSLQPYLSRALDQVAAVQELYKLWGLKASIVDASCSEKSAGPYYCEQARTDLAQIVKADRPVVLKMRVSEQSIYSVLYRVEGESAELLIANKRIQVPRQWLEDNWQGEYQYVWFSPINQTLKPGQHGELVRVLDQQISLAIGEPESGTDRFDAGLKSKVEAFQRWQGLDVDGIAGRHTLIKMDSIINKDAPRLSVEQGGAL